MKCACTVVGWDDVSLVDGVFDWTKDVKARKKHKCGECGCEIQPGEIYEYHKGRCEGEFFVAKTCLLCVEVRTCFCCSWCYSAVWEAIDEEKDDLNLAGLDAISHEARAKFFRIIDLEETDEEE